LFRSEASGNGEFGLRATTRDGSVAAAAVDAAFILKPMRLVPSYPPINAVEGGTADPIGPANRTEWSVLVVALTVMFAVPEVYADTRTRERPEPPTPTIVAPVAVFAEPKTIEATLPEAGVSK
jgi:hypothetical protein